MRELKFRVWDPVTKRMLVHEQDFIPLKITNWGVLRLSPNYEENLYEFISPADNSSWNIMQYTGLKDKNGVEIYEEDILINKNNTIFSVEKCWEDFIVVVGFKNGNFIDLKTSVALVERLRSLTNKKVWTDYEVIGNTFENYNLKLK